MVFKKRLAYYVLAAVLVIAPTWGCSDSPAPKPPPEAQQAEEEGGLDIPVVQTGVEEGTPEDSKQPTEGEGTSDGG